MLFSNLQWHDYVGALGAALIIFAYLYLQLGKFSGQNIIFSLLNVIGSQKNKAIINNTGVIKAR